MALDVPDREAILRVLEECTDELLGLRATLLQEHVWPQREGLARLLQRGSEGRTTCAAL